MFSTTWYEIYVSIQYEDCRGIGGMTAVLPVLVVYRSTHTSEYTLLIVDEIQKYVGVLTIVPSVLAASRSTDISEHTPSASEYAYIRLELTVAALTLGPAACVRCDDGDPVI